MNILMISDVYFPRINGVSTSIQTFRRALAPHGIKSTLIAPAYPEAAPDDDPALIRIPSRYLPLDPEDRVMSRAAIRALLPRLREERYDLVHVHTPFVAHYAALDLARALDLPCVATYHTFFEEYLFHYIPFLPRGALRALARNFSRHQCNAMDAVIVPSQAMSDTLAAYGVSRPRHVVPTGVPLTDYAEGMGGDAFRARLGLSRDCPLLLYVGRVAHEKNLGFLIRVMDRLRRQHPSAMLLITGEGPALQGLKAMVRRLELDSHIRFLGYLDRNRELPDCYRAADLFVFASRTETQGLVLLEAMAAGTPVVALAEMGTCDIIEPQRGTRVGPDNPQAYAALVGELLAKDETLREMGDAARLEAQRWGADEMATRLARLYREAVTAAARSAQSPAVQHP
ncbi:glycosyltransferase [Azoarcus sp. KH32C]|uniref:glycosyltransferase n=1 Tax=Azoarcus sp. KH32C TaxID=748247 RepID=UPI00023867FC|nr:glycosyltransferase [Azoarcus sp. KH32C]BAL23198.1 glycosyltransferase family protein [Azoarcus sp. KH32C]